MRSRSCEFGRQIPSIEVPVEVKTLETEVADKIETSPKPADITFTEIAEISAAFVKVTHSLGATFFKTLERTKLSVVKEDDIGNLPIMDFFT